MRLFTHSNIIINAKERLFKLSYLFKKKTTIISIKNNRKSKNE
jgi:hypothetical protein